MQLKTDRVVLEGSESQKIDTLINYMENLREEIDFKISNLKERTDTIYKQLKEIQGGVK